MKDSKRPRWAESDIIVFPEFLHSELLLESRIKNEIQPSIKLDGDSQICKPNLSPQGCPLGSSCPKRHTNPSPLNYTITPVSNTPQGRTVCKHWLRGLCKKGSDCEYLHEYNLRKMPECYFFTKHGFCSSGDECMYLHITPFHRRPECRSYTAGFCRAGPSCPNKHIKRVACPLYLVGFCPDGPECKLAHPPATIPDVERQARGDEHPRQQQHRERDYHGGGGGDQIPSYQGHAVSGDVVTDGMQFRRAPGKHMRGITCFKCGMEGHLANACPNPSVPGNRGGVERGPGGRPMIL